MLVRSIIYSMNKQSLDEPTKSEIANMQCSEDGPKTSEIMDLLTVTFPYTNTKKSFSEAWPAGYDSEEKGLKCNPNFVSGRSLDLVCIDRSVTFVLI